MEIFGGASERNDGALQVSMVRSSVFPNAEWISNSVARLKISDQRNIAVSGLEFR